MTDVIDDIARRVDDIARRVGDLDVSVQLDDIAQRVDAIARGVNDPNLDFITLRLKSLIGSAEANSLWSGLQAALLVAILWRVW